MKTIAIYPGSFNPFHIGHLKIVEKAERIFGKGNLIICFGVNPDKVDPLKKAEYLESIAEKRHELETKLDRQVKVYTGFLHDFISELEKQGNNVVLIRGLRNSDDFDYEVNQIRFINDFKKNLNVVYLSCDKEFEHISSSAIRKISELGADVTGYLIK